MSTSNQQVRRFSAVEPGASVPVRVGFVTEKHPADLSGWSGTNAFMSAALARAGAEIVPLFGYRRIRPLGALAKKAWARLALQRYYEIGRHPAVLRNYARQVEGKAEAAGVDAVFSTGTHLTAEYRGRRPLFSWADATVPGLYALYPGYERFWKKSYDEALQAERRAVKNTTALFFSSEWAAQSAVKDLGADPANVHTISFGANFEKEPTRALVEEAILRRSRDRVVLLFAGVQWKRKGGEKALAVARALAETGVTVELHLLGVEQEARPGGEIRSATGGGRLEVIWHGRISKATQEGTHRIEALFLNAHFLVLPTIADCTPMVFAEANAYAVPVVTHRTGGVPTMIRDELNGRMFPLNSSAQEQALWLKSVWADVHRYRVLAASSRAEYEARLNWQTAAARVMAVVGASLTKPGMSRPATISPAIS